MAQSSAKRGRPSKFTPDLVASICHRIGTGQTLASICREEDLDRSTVYDWLEKDPDFSQQFAQARARGFDAIAEECMEIAEDGSHDYISKKRSDGTEYEEFDSEHYQRSKLRIETRLKLLAKWDPKRYGDRTALTGADGGAIEIEARKAIDPRAYPPEVREVIRQVVRAELQRLEGPEGEVIEGEYEEKA